MSSDKPIQSCDHHHNQDPEQSITPINVPLSRYRQHLSQSLIPGNFWFAFRPRVWPFPSCKWNHITCILLSLVCFTSHSAFEIHPCCWHRSLVPFISASCSVCTDVLVCLSISSHREVCVVCTLGQLKFTINVSIQTWV